MRSQDHSAQVMLEYLVMAMIVLAAIIFGGPVLVNSIGARFKVAENNAGDAFSEKIQQASPELCSCVPMSDNASVWPVSGACGVGCGPLERNRHRTCLPAGCKLEDKCAESSDCCYPGVKGACGAVNSSSAATFCVSRVVLDAVSQAIFPGYLGQCVDTNGALRGCLDVEASYTAECGEGARRYACSPDSACAAAACESTVWTPAANTVCAGTSFTQTGDCGDTRPAVGTLAAQCPAANTVACGEPITSSNGCGTCLGTGTGDSTCPVGYQCRNGGCELICHYQPSGIYMAAHYYSATNCGHTPACNTANAPDANWISISQTGGRCGLSRWRHRQCGTLYRQVGQICHGDGCVRGMVANGGQVTFHLGKYNGVTKTCDFTSNVQKSVASSGGRMNSVTSVCDFCANCNTNCSAGFTFAGDNSNYGDNGATASWGN